MSSLPIEAMLQAGESERLEFKSGAAKPDAIGATVCAFLNTVGGTLLIGVSDEAQAAPLPDAQQTEAALQAYLQEHIAPLALWSVAREEVPGGEIVSIEVPAGQDKPYSFRDKIYVRQGIVSLAARGDEVRALVLARVGEPTRWERLNAPGLELDDLDFFEIGLTAEAARRRSQTATPASTSSISNNWEAIGAALDELALRRSGQLTNAAEVLFSRNPARRLPQTRIRASVFATDKGGDFKDDRVLEGNAFTLFEDVLAFLTRNVRIEARFAPGEAVRLDTPEYPFNALREGIINSLIHRDYASFTGGMSVGVYPSRIEIWNYGRLPDSLRVQDLRATHPSLPHNPDMAHVFYLRGLIERMGRGTQKILQECKDAGLPAPTWKVAPSGVTLTFFGKGEATKPLNARQKKLISQLEPGQRLQPSQYYEQMLTSQRRQGQRDLTALADQGWLRREGEGPATIYIRTDKKNAE